MSNTPNLSLSIIDRLYDTLDEYSVQRAMEQDPRFADYVQSLRQSLSDQARLVSPS